MKLVSLLCFFVQLLFRLLMAVFDFRRLHSAYDWLLRQVCLLWRFARTVLGSVCGYALLPFRLLKGRGSHRKLKGSAEDPPAERRGAGDREAERQLSEDPEEERRGFGDPEAERQLSEDPEEERRGSGDREAERRGSEEVEESRPMGQFEATAEKRPADSDRELALKRPRFEDEDGEFDGEEYRVDPTDEFYCGYDSTWETEEPRKDPPRRTRKPESSNKFRRFGSAARDMQNYRHDYPSQIRQPHWDQGSDDMPNLEFYLGRICSVPDGVYIHGFHQEWHGDYRRLESVHSYIQWLFPLQEPGMNYQAPTLTKGEIKEFCKNDTAKANLLKSYKLMLDFYGIELCDERTGEVQRAKNWCDRFRNLNSRTHNNLRITRILKCLGTLGYPHYQAPLVRFFLEQTLVHGELPDVKDSVLSYFLFAVLDKNERRSLVKFAYLSDRRTDEFVWCPRKIQRVWARGMESRRGGPCGLESVQSFQ